MYNDVIMWEEAYVVSLKSALLVFYWDEASGRYETTLMLEFLDGEWRSFHWRHWTVVVVCACSNTSLSAQYAYLEKRVLIKTALKRSYYCLCEDWRRYFLCMSGVQEHHWGMGNGTNKNTDGKHYFISNFILFYYYSQFLFVLFTGQR